MFPAAGKKRVCGFENPEPSSPKVTCIGQVRVKKKKQGKKMRSMSKRRGEVSCRKIEHTVEGGVGHDHHLQAQQQERLQHKNQRWVHLPLTICEALRAFGADFNYFLLCHSSCTSEEREKAEERVAAAAKAVARFTEPQAPALAWRCSLGGWWCVSRS